MARAAKQAKTATLRKTSQSASVVNFPNQPNPMQPQAAPKKERAKKETVKKVEPAPRVKAEPAPQVDSFTLTNRAMMVNFTTRFFRAKKSARDLAQETAAHHNSNPDYHGHQLSTLPKEAVRPFDRLTMSARAYHYSMTLPWLDDGARVLPAKAFAAYMKRMRGFERDFANLVDVFIANYPRYIADAKLQLNGLFRDTDYPSAEQIRSWFQFSLVPYKMPLADDFRVDLGDAEMKAEEDRIRQQLTERMDAWRHEASLVLFERIRKPVNKMVERLRAYDTNTDDKKGRTFRASLVDNVRELVDALPVLNVTEDPNIAFLTEKMWDDLCEHNADALKEDGHLREQVTKSAEAILRTVENFL